MSAPETVTLTEATRPLPGYLAARSATVPAGTYDVIDIDMGEAVGIDVQGVIVFLPLTACGLASCVDCDGRGSWSYRISVDEYEYEGCGSCDGDGIVTAAVAAEQKTSRARIEAEAWEAEMSQ